MGILDSPARKAAETVVGKFGTSVTIEETNERLYNTETRKAEGGEPASETVKAVVGQVTTRDLRAGLHGAREGDLKLTIAAAALSSALTTEKVVVFKGDRYQITALDPTYSGDQVATYTVAARR